MIQISPSCGLNSAKYPPGCFFFYPFLWVAGYKEQRYSPVPGEPV
nr:MAG TPA: hypothetical protein [Caudoviricetes sp.]